MRAPEACIWQGLEETMPASGTAWKGRSFIIASLLVMKPGPDQQVQENGIVIQADW